MTMRKRTLGAIVLAGLAVSGAGAFTASNTLPATSTAGYGAAAVTGATITNITYTPLVADPSKLATVVFTSTTDVTGKTSKMTLRTASGVVGAAYSCVNGVFLVTQSITCATADNPNIADFDSVGLTVTQ